MEAVKEIGMNYEETLQRFSDNEEILKKFVKKFPEDSSISELHNAAAAKDWNAVANSAHTLKGISGNLGLTELYNLTSSLVTVVHNKSYDVAEECISQVFKVTDFLCSTIRNIE